MDISRVQTPCMPCSDLPMELGADIGGDLVPSWDLSLSNPFLDDDTPGDEDFQALLASRVGTKSPGAGLMRGSYSLNDLTLLQQQPAPQPSWNHKLVSVKPKLEPVPEGGPSLMGGPLNLMPLGCTQPNSKPTTAPAGVNSQHIGLPHSGAASSGMMPINISQKQLQKRQAAALAVQGSGDSSDCQDNESTSSESMPRSYPSCNTLSAQLEMTRVRSETQLSGLAEQQQQQRQQQQHTGMVPVHGLMGGAAQGSTAAAVEAFRQSCALPAFNLMQGEQQRDGEGLSAAYAHHNHLAAARRASSGLPLRKSQSAVELGSWRSFNSPEEYWEMALVGEDGQATMGHANQGGVSDERLAKIQRYRERRGVLRGQARMPNYQPVRLKVKQGDGRLQHGSGMRAESSAAARRMPLTSSGTAGSWAAESGESSAAGATPSGPSHSGALDQQQGFSTQPLYAQAYSIPSMMGAASIVHQQHHHHHHHQPPLQQHLFGSPQQLTSHMHQRLRSSQRSHSFQGLSPASFIPPPPPPSNFKFSMVGGSSLPGTPSHVQGAQGGPHTSPTSDGSVVGSPASNSLLPSLLANPPRMLAPCLPPSHPLAGPGACSGSIFAAGRLSQQVSPAAGSLHIPGSACLSGTPMQAPLVHLPFSGQTIFSGGSARAAPRQPPQQHQQQPQPPQSSLAAQPSARGPEAVGSMRPHLAGAAPNNSTGAGLARAAAPACAQPMVMGEGSGD